MGNRELGRIGEQAAAELLQMEGYEILERNYRCQAGEIDLIAARCQWISGNGGNGSAPGDAGVSDRGTCGYDYKRSI